MKIGDKSFPSRTLPAEICGLDVAVCTRRDEEGDLLLRELQLTRSRVRHIWPLPDVLPETVDVVYCDFSPDLPNRCPWVPGAPKAALVLLLPSCCAPDLGLLKSCVADAVLHRPVVRHAVLVSLVQARLRFTYEQRLRARIDKLDETLRTLRIVERAKLILMGTKGMQEDEAYEFLRRQAMDRRVGVSTVAGAVVDAHELLK